MSTLFALLFMISLGSLIWGLVSPSHLSKFANKSVTRREAGVGLGTITLVLAILTGATAPVSNTANNNGNSFTKKTNVSTSSATPQKTAPTITTKTETEKQTIPYSTKTIDDSTLSKGTSTITTYGVNGEKTLTYKITYTDGTQTGKRLISTKVTKQPIDQVATVGTYEKPAQSSSPPTAQNSSCDPNYSGACVPNVYPTDVDCGSGSGNGPYYVYGTVRVVGVDRYGLDRDGDGYGCE